MWKKALLVILLFAPFVILGNTDTVPDAKKENIVKIAGQVIPVTPNKIGNKKSSRLKRSIKWLEQHADSRSCPLCSASVRYYYPR